MSSAFGMPSAPATMRKGILQEAVRNCQYWRLKDPAGVWHLRDLQYARNTEHRHMCQGLNSLYFHIIGDGHQPTSRGVYTNYMDSLLKVG